MKIKDLASEERPRERLRKHGPRTLSNAELLALILRQGSKEHNVIELAQTILQQYTLKKLSRVQLNTLKKVKGLGEVKASQIMACFELARRLAALPREKKVRIDQAKDIAKLFMPEMATLSKEHVKGVYLDTRRRIIKEETIFIGSLNTTLIHPRELFQTAITEGAAALILVHNHPSGDPSPSEADLLITKQLVEAGKLLEIEVLDHVIIGHQNYFSMREKGCL